MEHKKTRGLWMVTVRDQDGKVPDVPTQANQQLKVKEDGIGSKCSDTEGRSK